VIAARCGSTAEDLISLLLRARVEGEELSVEHIVGFLRVILPAGAETSTRTTGSLLTFLLSNPDQLELLRRNRNLLGGAIEEALRLEAPVPIIYRLCMEDTLVGGVKIPAGSAVMVAVGSANRDERHFEDPDRFDITRPLRPQQMAFGYGPHVCVGIHLGRQEVDVAVSALLDRLPNLRFDPAEPVPEIVGVAFRGPTRLPVVWD
jgi:cytochrome P450